MADLGGIALSEIESLVKEVVVPTDAGLSPVEHFIKHVAKLVVVRAAKGEDHGITAFVLCEFVEAAAKGRPCSVVPALRHGNDAVSQRILLSNAKLGVAFSMSAGSGEDAYFAALKEHGLGGHPVLVVDWRGVVPMASFYATGIDNSEDVQDVQLSASEISPDDVKEGLHHAWNTRLRTPQLVADGHGASMWSIAAQGRPAGRPEERIQGILVTYLRARYASHEVRAEVHNSSGRLDILIFAIMTDSGGDALIKKLWLLELKALTDRTSTGEPVAATAATDALTKGLTQAISYRDAEFAKHAALCCYDMRKDDQGDNATFAPIQSEANDNNVHLWRWFLYRSSELFRQAERATRLARTT